MAAVGGVRAWLGGLGRSVGRFGDTARTALEHVSGIWLLLLQALRHIAIAPTAGGREMRRQLAPMLRNVGVRSFPIVALVNLLTGAILVLQTGDVLQSYGQIQQAPGMVALSMTRELGPMMTAVVMTARVGASYTAVLAAMRINEEIDALQTMAIHPVGFLVAPRVLAMIVMMPCLTVLAFLIGMGGGALIANAAYDISFPLYVEKTEEMLAMNDVLGGLLKAVVFSLLISTISCYYGFIAKGGPTGLGRYTMVSVVTSLVVVVATDALLTGFWVNYTTSGLE